MLQGQRRALSGHPQGAACWGQSALRIEAHRLSGGVTAANLRKECSWQRERLAHGAQDQSLFGTWSEGSPGNSIEEHDLTASITNTGKRPS